MNLKIKQRRVDGVVVLELSGRMVRGKETTFLRETLNALAEKGERNILLNLAAVDSVDSSGLSTLAAGYPAGPHHGQLKLLNPTRRVRGLLKITRLLPVLEVFGDEAKAVSSFQEQPLSESLFAPDWRADSPAELPAMASGYSFLPVAPERLLPPALVSNP